MVSTKWPFFLIIVSRCKRNGEHVLVDEDVYLKLKDCHLRYCRNGGNNSIRVYHGDGHTTSLTKHILNYDHFRQRIAYINDDEFDNRRSNMRVDLKQAAQRVVKLHCNNKYKGVAEKNNPDRCCVYLVYKNRTIHVCSGKDLVALAKIYDAHVAHMYGKNNCYLNFPNELRELTQEEVTKLQRKLQHIDLTLSA